MDSTNEFSFILKPSEHGVGVFATQDIKQGTHLRLFGDNEVVNLKALEREKESVPEFYQEHCLNRGDKLICPQDFGHMHIGWYLNHSNNYNAIPDEVYEWYASRDIKSGEEILVDYNTLDEPDESKADYYK